MVSRRALVPLLGLVCALLCVLFAVRLIGSKDKPTTPNPAEGLTVLCPDLGKADGFLLLSEKGAALIDTGEDASAETLLNLLKEQDVTELDALVLSHFDKDHIGGAAAILDAVPVKTLYRTAFTENSDPYDELLSAIARSETEVVTVTETTNVTAAGAEWTLYPPLADHYDKDEDNNASLIARVNWEGSALLFTGDALKDRIREFLDQQYEGGKCAFLKVPHHGRERKPTALLAEAVSPEAALVTSSAEEPESEKLTEYLEQAQIPLYRTRQGLVTLHCHNGEMKISQ